MIRSHAKGYDGVLENVLQRHSGQELLQSRGNQQMLLETGDVETEP